MTSAATDKRTQHSELVEMLKASAPVAGQSFTEQECQWLAAEHSGDGPAVLGELSAQSRFEDKVAVVARHQYESLKVSDRKAADKFLELVRSLRSGDSYTARLAATALALELDSSIAGDVGRFAVLGLGQVLQIMGLLFILFIGLTFILRC